MKKIKKKMNYKVVKKTSLIILIISCINIKTNINGENKINIEKYLKLILENNPELKEASSGIEEKKGFLTQAKYSKYPKVEVLSIAGPSPEIIGDSQESRINFNKWGPFLKLDISITQPIHTFGRISSGIKAAENAIKVAKYIKKEVKWSIILRSKELFYGYIFAYSSYNNIIKEAENEIAKVIETAEEEYDFATGKVSKADLSRLYIAKEELNAKKAYTEKMLILTETALKDFIKHNNIKGFEIEKKEISKENIKLKDLNTYIKLAFEYSPKYLQLKNGIKARKALSEFEKSKNNPILFIAGKLSTSFAPNIDKQNSVFANDPFNEIFGGIGIGIKWDFSFANKGNVNRAKSEYNKLIHKNEFAENALPILIKKHYLEIKEKEKLIEINYNAYRKSLEWMGFALIAFESGTGNAKDALEGLVATLLYKYNYYNSIFEYNMAIAKMSSDIGREISDLRYW